MTQVKEKRLSEILFLGIILLLFLHLLSDFIESIYSYCLLTTGLNASVASVLLFLTPLLLVVFGQKIPPFFILVFGELAIVFRIMELYATAGNKIILSGLGVGFFLLFFPAYLHFIKDSERNTRGSSLGLGLALATLLLIVFRTASASIDLVSYGQYIWLNWFLAGAACILLPVVLIGGDGASKSRNRQIFGKESDRPSVFLPSWGIISTIALVYFVFSAPSIIARWTGGNYMMIVSVLAIATAAFAIYNLFNPKPHYPLPKPVLILWNFLFVGLLTLLVFRLQIAFPPQEAAYPFYAETSPSADHVLQYLVLLLSPVLYLNMSVFSAQVIKTSVSIRRIGFAFFLASLLFLLLIFFHIFTTVYDYIPLIGPFFRDKYWMLHGLAGLGLIIPMICSRQELTSDRGIRFARKDRVYLGLLLTALTGLILVSNTTKKPVPLPADSTATIKVMTYNIQQGYSRDGLKSYREQIEAIRQNDPDILGLQETDSLRIAGGNSDLIRYYANQLNMHSYSGPTPVDGTFGIALLSKYPIMNPQTFFMHSVGEQTATIEAQIMIGEKIVTVYVTHLGNDGDLIQQQAILKQTEGRQRAIVMGDFNFDPDSLQYELTTRHLIDTWVAGSENQASEVNKNSYRRIDHIFTTPDFDISSSRFLFASHSDHPALITELAIR